MSLTSAAIAPPSSTQDVHILTGNYLPEDWSLTELANASFDRIGQDLQIVGKDGGTLLIKGYFSADKTDDLELQQGTTFHAEWVERLSTQSDQFAQTANTQKSSIGSIESLSGTVTVERADGSTATLKEGDPVFQDDVVTTGADGNIGIVFADGSNFSLGGNGKMILDEMVYDPAAQDGSGNISVLNGTFAFISGQIAKTSPDAMKVTTPSATIGFRGTSGSGEVHNGETSIVLIRDPDGTIGEIIIVTDGGIATLGDVLQSAFISSDPMRPIAIRTMTAEDFTAKFGTVASHLPAAKDFGQSDAFIQNATMRELSPEQTNENTDDEGDDQTPADDTPPEDTGDTPPASNIPVANNTDSFSGDGTPASTNASNTPINSNPPPSDEPADTNTAPEAEKPTNNDDNSHDDTTSSGDTSSGTGITESYAVSGSYSGTEYADNLQFVLESGASGTLNGLGGDDILTGADGSDILIGGEGNDTLTDLYGAGDELYGGNGDDRLVISSGFTGVLNGGDGTDTVDLSQSDEAHGATFATSGSNMVVDFTDINVSITAQNVENVIGTDHEDMFNINRSATIDGGDGNDTLLISSSEAVTVNMTTKKAQNSEMTVSFDNVENFTLTSHDDTFIGTMDAGTVDMGSGNDAADYSELTSGLTITQSSTEVTINSTTTIKGLETLIGSKCNDTINVNSSTSTMAFDGDSGTDKLSFANLNPATNDGIFIDMDSNGAIDDDGFYTALGNNSVTGTGTGALGSVEVKFKSIETFHLTSGDDTFVGSDEDETIIANGGHDNLDGKGGKDKFVFNDNDNTATVNGGDIDEGNVIDLTGISGDLSITLSGEGEGSFTLPSASGDVNFTAISDFKLSSTNSTTFNGSDGEEAVWLNGGNSNEVNLGDGDDFLQINQISTESVGFLNGSDGTDKLAFNSDKIAGVNIDIMSEGFQVVSEDNGLSGVISIALFEDFSLTDGNDYFRGESWQTDTINAGKGNDTVAYNGGDDTMDGGAGIDILKVEVETGLSASIDLDDGTLTVVDTGQQTTQSTSEIENFELYILGDGDDTFVGADEDDYVIGGKGNDTLTGNDGADSFAFSIGSTVDNATIQNLGLDTVTDFEKDLDKIALNLELFDYDDTGFTIVSTVDTDGVENSSYGSGHGVVMREIDGDTQLWYYDNLSDTSSGGYQFATLSDVTDMDASDIRTYTSNEDLMGQTSGSMQSAVIAAGGVLPA